MLLLLLLLGSPSSHRSDITSLTELQLRLLQKEAHCRRRCCSGNLLLIEGLNYSTQFDLLGMVVGVGGGGGGEEETSAIFKPVAAPPQPSPHGLSIYPEC